MKKIKKPRLVSVRWASRSSITMRGVVTEEVAVYRKGKRVQWKKLRPVYVPALDVFGTCDDKSCDREECRKRRAR